MAKQRDTNRINIRPEVSILSVLRHLNYKPWFALAEFVDNSLQSFIANRPALGGDAAHLDVTIALETRASAHSGLTWQDTQSCARVFWRLICSVVLPSCSHTESRHGYGSHRVGGSGWLL